MSKKGIADEQQVTTASLHLVIANGELASLTLGLVEIQTWFELENLATDLETDWLQFRSDLGAWSHDLAEIVIGDAIDVGDIASPFLH